MSTFCNPWWRTWGESIPTVTGLRHGTTLQNYSVVLRIRPPICALSNHLAHFVPISNFKCSIGAQAIPKNWVLRIELEFPAFDCIP